MKVFGAKVEKVDSYIVELDEEVLDDKWMREFRDNYYSFYTLEEHAEHISQFVSRFGSRYIDGYGIPLENGEPPAWANKDDVNRAINIKTLNEDSYVDSYAYELEQ